jgi:hypothetical protein
MKFNFLKEYFFNYKTLVDGNPPMDRNCYTCSKIGHMTKECPNGDKNNRKFRNHNGNMNKFADIKESKCYNCNNFGHLARDCQESNNKMRCFQCNQMGHLSKECPNVNKVNNANNISAPAIRPATISHQIKAPSSPNSSNIMQPTYPQYYESIQNLPPMPLSSMNTSFSKINQQQQQYNQQRKYYQNTTVC